MSDHNPRLLSRRLSFAIVVSMLLAQAALGEESTVRAEADEAHQNDGFVPMFDGKTLDGWSVSTPKAAKAWYVRDGYIVGEGDKGRSYLIYAKNKDIADFEMKFVYRFPDEGNSGVNVRSRKDKSGKRDYQAYHVDIGHVGIGPQVLGAWDFHTPGRREHRCFRGERLVIDKDDKPTLTKIKDAVTLKEIRKHGWNKVHVIVKDNHFWFSINGKPSSEFIERLPKEKRLKSGMIQLQLHDPGMIVEFKDLWIKVLDKPKKQRLDGAVEADELSLEQANCVMEPKKRRYMEFMEDIAAAVKAGELSEEEAERKLIAVRREMFEGTP